MICTFYEYNKRNYKNNSIIIRNALCRKIIELIIQRMCTFHMLICGKYMTDFLERMLAEDILV